MGLLIADTDFVGKWTVAKNSFTDLNPTIDQYEEPYLRDLLGNALFALFKADINVTTKKPVTARFLNLYNAIAQDVDQSQQMWPFRNLQIRSDGMKPMVLGFMYWFIMRDQAIKNTTGGNVLSEKEGVKNVEYDDSNTPGRYNEAINSYENIQYYIFLNKDTYPEFNGITKGRVGWML